jgi:predicted TIM-barrel fold metal-dependent hydrolase
MRRSSSVTGFLVAATLVALWTQPSSTNVSGQPPAGADGRARTAGQGGPPPPGQGRGRGAARAATPAYAVLRAPAGVKEGETWIPELPSMESLLPRPGWKPSDADLPWMPATLLKLPRTNIVRAKYPVIDVHLHAGNTTPELITLMDGVGVAAEVNLNGGTGASIDSALKASEPYKGRVADFLTWSPTVNGVNINDPGYSAAWAAELERGFKEGAMGLKVAKTLGLGPKNPDGSYIQADDPRLDAGWEMCAKYNKPVLIHTSDSIGRFYPISPSNERYEAGLWHGSDDQGNYYQNGFPSHELIEKARERMLAKHPKTIFILAHMAMLYYDPAKVAALLDKYPNAMVDTSATVQDLGRAPRLWRDFIIKYQDRILFGSDGNPRTDPDTFWRPHFRFFETYDEYFEHPAQIRLPGGSPGHGRWNISGIALPDPVLRKVYYLNALKYLPSLRDLVNRQLAARGLQ